MASSSPEPTSPADQDDKPAVPLNLDTIPVEVLLQIFNFVDATDLLRNVSLVSKYFNAILENEMTWKIKMEKRWGGVGETKYPPIDLLPDDPEEEPTPDPPPPTSPYTKIFTTTRFPWSRACVKREEQIKLWTTNSEDSKLSQATLRSHIGCIDSIHLFNRNNTMLLASGSRDRTISLWNVDQALNSESEDNNGSKIKVLNRAHDGWIWDFAVNSNNLFSCSWDTTAKIWDLTTLQVAETFKSNSALLSISSTNTTTAIGCFNRKILLLDPRNPKTPTSTITTHTRSVLSLGLDTTYIISCGEDGLVARHDLRTLTPVQTLTLPQTTRPTYPTCTSFRETLINLPYFYVGDNTGQIHLIDLLNFKITRSQNLHQSPVRGIFNNLGSVVSCSRDGKLIVSTPSLGLSNLTKVDVGDKIELPCVHSLDNVVACGGGDGAIRVWGCTTGVL